MRLFPLKRSDQKLIASSIPIQLPISFSLTKTPNSTKTTRINRPFTATNNRTAQSRPPSTPQLLPPQTNPPPIPPRPPALPYLPHQLSAHHLTNTTNKWSDRRAKKRGSVPTSRRRRRRRRGAAGASASHGISAGIPPSPRSALGARASALNRWNPSRPSQRELIRRRPDLCFAKPGGEGLVGLRVGFPESFRRWSSEIQ